MATEAHKFFVIKQGKILDGGFVRNAYFVDEGEAYTFSRAMEIIQGHQSSDIYLALVIDVTDTKNAEQYADRVKELLGEASD